PFWRPSTAGRSDRDATAGWAWTSPSAADRAPEAGRPAPPGAAGPPAAGRGAADRLPAASPAAGDRPAAAAHQGAGSDMARPITAAEHERIAQAIRAAETRTSGEIYCVL